MATQATSTRRASWDLDPAMAEAGPDDLVLAASGDDAEAGLRAAAGLIDARPAPAPARRRCGARSLRAVEADLAIVSVPGEYAALEAHKALGAGMDVLLFSDGVSVEDEVSLKQRAHAWGGW